MRVAIFTETYYPFISGVVTHIETLKNGLEAQGHEVLIVTLSPDANKHYIKDGVLYCPAVPLKKIYGFGVANPVNLKRLRIVRKFAPDLIHIHTEFSMGIFGLYAAKHLKVPAVYTLHTMYDDYVFYVIPESMVRIAKPAAHAYIRNVARKATEIIGPSHKVAEYLAECGVKKHINIVPNAVDLSDFLAQNVSQKDVARVKKQLGIQPDDICLCFVGRLGKEKSIDVLIEYFARAFKNEERFKLFILGDGPEKEKLQTLVRQLRVGHQVYLLGHVDHDILPPYYQACNLFSTASLSEMNSISLLEATASGLYAVNRLDKLNRDQVIDGVNGEVFETAEGFEKIVRAYAEKSDKDKMALKAAVSEYATRYGPNEFTKGIMEVYDKALAEYQP